MFMSVAFFLVSFCLFLSVSLVFCLFMSFFVYFFSFSLVLYVILCFSPFLSAFVMFGDFFGSGALRDSVPPVYRIFIACDFSLNRPTGPIQS